MENNETKLNFAQRAKKFFSKRIWDSDMSNLGGIKGACVGFVRILITTINGIMGKRSLVQASSLSYATLLAIGPILAIVVMFAGMFAKKHDRASSMSFTSSWRSASTICVRSEACSSSSRCASNTNSSCT